MLSAAILFVLTGCSLCPSSQVIMNGGVPGASITFEPGLWSVTLLCLLCRVRARVVAWVPPDSGQQCGADVLQDAARWRWTERAFAWLQAAARPYSQLCATVGARRR